jgi:hemerythrin-like domain-containing protein
MNRATQNLEDDHIYILRLIDVMQTMTKHSAPEIAHLEEAVALIRNYADGLHHAKEESLLFPLMAERGFSTTQGPVAVMLQEHTIGRNYVKGIDDNIQLLKQGDLSALNLIYSNINGYSELLQNHIYKENTMLFRMADNALSQSDQDSLFTQFEKLDIQPTNNNSKSDYLARISQLEHVYKHA